MNKVWNPLIIKRLPVTYSLRQHSAWINEARGDTDSTLSRKLNVEKLFIDEDVQSLMRDLTGLDIERKIFKERRTSSNQRSHFALMTDERLEKTMEKMKEEASYFLQFVPVKEPRTNKFTVLSQDPEISQFDNSKFVFTDITFDATDQDRTVVVREVDGTLRTANVEEHDRMNRIYYPKENRPVFPPKVFENPWLEKALDRDEHEFVLDWACYFYEPDDPSFVALSRNIFDSIIESGKFEAIHSTRHFGPFVFYLALNGNISPLLNYFGGEGRIRECANLIRLQKTLHPDWRVAIGSEDSDEKIINDFIKQNTRFTRLLPDLRRFLKDGTLKKDSSKAAESAQLFTSDNKTDRRKAAINTKNIGTERGPLGEMSSEYSVKVATGNAEEKLPDRKGESKKQTPRHRQDRYKSNLSKPKKDTE